MNDVTTKMQQEFDYTVVEFAKDKFLIRNDYPAEVSNSGENIFQFDEENSSELGLLWIIVCCLIMDGESVSLSSLLTGLQFFGIYENQEHEIYGNIKNLITKKFVKEAYLRIEKEDNNITADERSNVDPYLNAKVFLGNRSLAMVDKKKVLDYVSQVYGNKPEDWVEQFDEFGG